MRLLWRGRLPFGPYRPHVAQMGLCGCMCNRVGSGILLFYSTFVAHAVVLRCDSMGCSIFMVALGATTRVDD